MQRGTRIVLEIKHREAKLNGDGATLTNLYGLKFVNKFKKEFKDEMHLDIITIGSYVWLIVGCIVVVK